MLDGGSYLLRPIKPVDVQLYPEFLAKVTADDIRLRFLAPRKNFQAEMLVRLTQLDYQRDMAFVALNGTGALAGIGRLSADPDHDWAEFALLVRTDLQSHGLGWALLEHLIDYGRADGLSRIEGYVLNDNTKMLAMCREFGFKVRRNREESGVSISTLDLRQ